VRIQSERKTISRMLKYAVILCLLLAGCKEKSTDQNNSQTTAATNNEPNTPAPDKTVADTNAVTNQQPVTIEQTPVTAETYINRASLCYSKGQYDDAVSNYTKAIELKPQDAVLFYNRANAYKAKSQYDKAISDYTEAFGLIRRISRPITIGRLHTRLPANTMRLSQILQRHWR
jgi:tetratricopeptide (TPR) repeat protein